MKNYVFLFFCLVSCWSVILGQTPSAKIISQKYIDDKVIIKYELKGVSEKQNIVITPYYVKGGLLTKMRNLDRKTMNQDFGVGNFSSGTHSLIWNVSVDNSDSVLPHIEIRVRKHLWYVAYSALWGDPVFYDKEACGKSKTNAFSPPFGIQAGILRKGIGGYVSLRYNAAQYASKSDYFYHPYFLGASAGANYPITNKIYVYAGVGYRESANKNEAIEVDKLRLYETNNGSFGEFGVIFLTHQLLGKRFPLNANIGGLISKGQQRLTIGMGTHF